MILGLGLTSAAIAYVVSLAGAFLFVFWMILDCSFPRTASIVGQDVRLRFLRDAGVRYDHRWDNFGPRILVFAVLAGLSLAAGLVVVLRPFLTFPPEGRVWGMLLAASLIAVWIALLASYRRLWWWAFRRRIFRFQGAMEAAVPALLAHWPEKEITLPDLGTYTVADRDHDLLFREGPSSVLPFREVVGGRIARTDEGDLRFDVASDPLWWVEHRRDGRTPPELSIREVASPPHTVTRQRQYCMEYAPGWYLVRYDLTLQMKDELDPEIAAEIAQRPVGMRLPHQGGRFRMSSDLEVEVVIWFYAPYMSYPDDGLSVVAQPRKAGVYATPIDFRRGLLRKGTVLRLHYEPDASQSTHCDVVPENYDEWEPYFVDVKERKDRDYANYSISLSYIQLDKDFEWLPDSVS